jgi:acyl-CoA synthetase (AMP-forming)/AMP-acid ligase II
VPAKGRRGRICLEATGVKQVGIALSSNLKESPSVERRRADLAFLQYTSGSTSMPKGVMVSHGNLLENLEMIHTRLGNHAGSTHVSWIPLYHDMGLIMNLLQPIYLGAQSVLMMPSGFMLRPLNWLRAIHTHCAEVAAAPNFAYDLCVDRFRPEQLEGVDLSCWKVALNGAEPVRAATLARFTETFAPYGFDPHAMHPAYGLAEATLMVTGARRGALVGQIDVSVSCLQRGIVRAPAAARDALTIVGCGNAVKGISIAIVNPDTKRKVAAGAIGEIWVQGDSVALGYWQRPDESKAIFKARIDPADLDLISDEATWLRTGDLGHLDEVGELYIVGRMKDVVIIRGVNHYPQDIETTVAESHPALRRNHGAVFGSVDEHGIEQIVIVQEVERTNRKILRHELISAIREAAVKNHDIAFREIVLVKPGTIPKTTSGKIQRALTRQRWLDGTLELYSGLEFEIRSKSTS